MLQTKVELVDIWILMISFSKSSTKGAPSNAFLKIIDESQDLFSMCHKAAILN